MGHNKIILTIILGIFLISGASAFNFDNKLSYEKDDMKVKFKNAFGLGKDLGTIELKSHNSVTEIKKVGFGEEEVVMFYDFKGWELYKNGLGEVIFTDERTGEKIEKDYYFVEWKEIDVANYINNCMNEVLENGTIIKNCKTIQDGTKKEFNWVKYDSNDIPAKNIRIGLKTYVGRNDYIDGVWTIAGKKVKKHITWAGDIDTENLLYYNLEETEGTITYDAAYKNNGTLNGAVINQDGIVGQCYTFTNDTIISDDNLGIEGADTSTINFWVKDESYLAGDVFISFGTYSATNMWRLQTTTGNKLLWDAHTGGNNWITAVDMDDYAGEWVMLTFTYNGTHEKIYVNATEIPSSPRLQVLDTGASKLWIGYDFGGAGNGLSGQLDEISAFDEELNLEEIEFIYNEHLGCVYGEDDCGTSSIPVVTLENPINYTNYTATNEVDFECYAYDYVNSIVNVSLYIDGTLNETNTDGLNDTSAHFTGKVLSEGTHDWTCDVYSNISESFKADIFILDVDTTPNIVYGEGVPANHYNSTTNSFESNVTLTETFFKNVTFNLYFVNGTLRETETFTDATRSKTWIDLPDADYSHNVTTATTTSQFNNTETRNISVDISNPALDVFYPTANIEHQAINTNLSVNWSVNDTNLDICIYNYNTTNMTVPCLDNATNINITNVGYNNLTFWANDTFGNVNSTYVEWEYSIFENSREFSATAIQTALETFRFLGLKSTGVLSTAGSLWYNGTSYSTITTTSGSEFNLTSLVNIPITTEGTVSFFWEITFINATGTFSFNTTNSTQEVGVLEMYECYSPAIDGLTLNFTTYDSTNLTTLNTTLEATFQFYPIGGTGSISVEYLFSDLNENRTNYMYCLNSSGKNVTLDAFISYGATNYDSREYIINDGIIGNFTQNIPLYLIETDLTDIITITVQDQSYDPITGALVAVQKWNIGTNTYSTIGMLTTSSVGQGIMDLELYNTWYRAVVSIDGEIEETTDVQKLSSTSWIITIQRGEDNPYDLFGSVAHGLIFENTTNITSFTWLDSSGYTSQGCLVINNATTLEPTTIQNSCIESVSGTIDYYISGNGDYTIYGIIYLTGYNQSQIVDVLEIRLGTPLIITTVSPFGKVISFIMIGTAGLIGVSAGSAILGVFLIIAMLIVCLYFGFLNITWGFIWGIVSIGILILFLQRRKR